MSSGPARDFVGYGPEPPAVHWRDGALLAVNLVINYEEGAEYSVPDDGVNDSWGEYSFQFGPESAISAPRGISSTGAGSGSGACAG